MNIHNIKDYRYYLFKNNSGDAIAVVDVAKLSAIISTTRFGDEKTIEMMDKSYRIIPISVAEKETYCDVFGNITVVDIFDMATFFFEGTSEKTYFPWYWEFGKSIVKM